MRSIDLKTSKKADPFYVDFLIMLLAVSATAVFHYGKRAAFMLVFSAVCALAAEKTVLAITRQGTGYKDFSPACVGLVLALTMPVTAHFYVPAAGAVFGIFVAKLPFGGKSSSHFSASAIGYLFCFIFFQSDILLFPPYATAHSLPVFGSYSGDYVLTSEAILQNSKSVKLNNIFDILTGSIPSAIGTGTLIVLLSLVIYLFIRRTRVFMVSFGFFAACMLFACIARRVSGTFLDSLLAEMLAGNLVFCAIFVVPLPPAVPFNAMSRTLYGGFIGVLTMLIRYMSNIPLGAFLAVLIANLLFPLFFNAIALLDTRFAKRENSAGKEEQ
jgi:electron transport complex protein RnfD